MQSFRIKATNHTAFTVSNLAAAVGSKFPPPGKAKGGKNVYVRGPDGIVIEFQESGSQ